ncbi:MAG: hypothetical protein J6J58_04810 [Oscillospiraceae bacterium]|nr:hypothetical protein [Oscillospiraceae bacterium]
MKKLIVLLFAAVFIFSGCSKEEKPKYDLALCDTNMPQMSEYLSESETENYAVETVDFSNGQLTDYLLSIKEEQQYITSVSIYSENITDETAKQLIDFVKEENIPVIFAFSDVSAETLTSYDKAFSIVTDYIHAGEITAVKLKQLWTEGIIDDSNGDQIFTFSVVKDETEKADFENFYNTVVAGIELYGIPMQISGTVSPADIADTDALAALKSENEGILVVSEAVLPVLEQYATESEAVEIITIQQGVENSLAGKSHTLNCFVDYKNYKTAVDEILQNYNNRQYPLVESSFFVKDRTVYIPASV